ncbi:uncharacterized protein N0V89_001599 [Didymosphaeria variabile]|uniref:Uncharacterized protein n=1 Tax=Didymosphaeria variabile TaxID=1932322 RepID=A0A9W8XYE6_9PLEO|nr:uncharacterized protein N0V89_001599 [Didymosphaeria variabile]KAJ4361030.1 hypothetical protein N0V89_001599 [Didymosphaeria variabile]
MPPQVEYRLSKGNPKPEVVAKLIHEACGKIVSNIKDGPKNVESYKRLDVTGRFDIGDILIKDIDNNQSVKVAMGLFYKGKETLPFDINLIHPEWLHFISTYWEKWAMSIDDIYVESEKNGQIVEGARNFEDPNNDKYACYFVYRFEAPRQNEAEIPAEGDRSVGGDTGSSSA